MKTWSSVLIVIIVGALGYLIVTQAPKKEMNLGQENVNEINQENQEEQASITTQDTTTMNTQQNLKIETINEGTGEPIKSGQKAVMNYTGRLEDGTVFDSNVDPKFNHVEPFEFVLGQNQVIQGWEQGVLGMKVGEKRVLTIPSTLAYGANGIPGVIPGGATLVFDVELVAIK